MGGGVRGISPENFFKTKMSVEAILMHFETNFACEIRLIVQALLLLFSYGLEFPRFLFRAHVVDVIWPVLRLMSVTIFIRLQNW